MKRLTNQMNIAAWDTYPPQKLREFGDEGDFGRQQLLNPQLMRLMGDVLDKLILDAGCGNGYLCRKLAKRGALVTGLEPAKSLFDYAKQSEREEPLGITYVQQDLSTYHAPHSFDVVVSNMVFMDIVDYESAIENCIEALKPGGQLIFSITHPCFENSSKEYQEFGHIKVSEYLNPYSIQQEIGNRFHRPLQNYINFVISHNCTIQEVAEPQLSREIADKYPQHAKGYHIPSYLIISAIKL